MKKKLLLITSLIFVLMASFILIPRVFGFFSSSLKPFLPFTSYLLGSTQPTTYLFLLGNDTEARANGGFAGSYVKITLSSPRFDFLSFRVFEFFHETKSEISFHDIYVPNGQLAGYVKPPDAIQQAFSHGTWELANADYDPNFPTTATTIRWFLEKGKEVNPDVLGIINLSTIKKVLGILGSFPISEKGVLLTPENIYLYLQGKAELNFFPGSTQKADALHSVGVAALNKIKSLSLTKKYQITKLLYEDLKKQNIVLNSSNPKFQSLLEEQQLAGVYDANSYDNYGFVELNLGANKSNAYVTRQSTHQISLDNNQIKHSVQIQFQNTSPEANPNPPLHYGGNYISFVRFYLPKNATNIQINHAEVATSSTAFAKSVLENQTPITTSPQVINNFQVVGFWHITYASNTSQIDLSYTLPQDTCHSREGGNPSNKIPCPYTLTILKQNGFPTSPQALNIFGSVVSTSLETRFTHP